MGTEQITFGGGCFWCVEAVFRRVDGVVNVESGYAGGSKPNPTYKEVCTGSTGHAEVVQVTFDSQRVGLEQLLDLFWRAHDPTTLNRQGADAGTQYRSVIYYHDPAQGELARRSMADAQSAFSDPIVTEIEPLDRFYPAEDYHQDFFEQNPSYGYCRVIIQPKLQKLGLDDEAAVLPL